jgi:membrane associated rhomboid family serine protease
MGGMIPLGDASRRPRRIPFITVLIILVNGFVFLLELKGGEAFVTKWSLIPAEIVGRHHWITILTAMFMHGSWSHIIGNMVFLWAFGPEIEDAMNPLRYAAFYLLGGLAATLAFHGSQPRRERCDCRGYGRLSDYLPSRSDSHTSIHLYFCSRKVYSRGALDRFVVPHTTLQCRLCCYSTDRRSGLHGSCWRVPLRGCHRTSLRRPTPTRRREFG